MLVFQERGKPEYPEKTSRSKDKNQEQTQLTYDTRGPFLEIPDNFPGPGKYFLALIFCQLMVIIGTNLAICLMKLQRLKFSFQTQ